MLWPRSGLRSTSGRKQIATHSLTLKKDATPQTLQAAPLSLLASCHSRISGGMVRDEENQFGYGALGRAGVTGRPWSATSGTSLHAM